MKKILLFVMAFAFTLSEVANAQHRQGVETLNNQKTTWNISGYWGGNANHNIYNCNHAYHSHHNNCKPHYPPVYGKPNGKRPGYRPPHFPPYGGHNGAGYPPNYYGPYHGNYVDQSSLLDFIHALNREAFEANKLNMAIFFAKHSNLRVEQIGKILDQFTFDSSRLQFTENAYQTCIDKHNYITLRPHFTFASTFQSLLKNIGAY